jgi:NAD(P)-dependent dehydrogenase (short-subunit alcohol dehydrogenase family)
MMDRIMPRISVILSFVIACAAIIYNFQLSFVFDSHNVWPTNGQDIAHYSSNKTIVVTGANSGLGYSTVKLLAHAGTADCIIMACRNLTRCEEARSTILETATKVALVALELDLAYIHSVKHFAEQVQLALENRHGLDQQQHAIHILINNAGIMGIKYSLADGTNVEMQMQVNHLGHFALTSLLLPNLLAASNDSHGSLNALARVVSVSSLLGSLGFALQLDDINYVQRRSIINPYSWFRGPLYTIQSFLQYAASKRANLLFTHGLHKRFYEASKGRLQAVAAHPGYSRTSLAVSGWDFLPLWFRTYFSKSTLGSMSADDGALTILRAALDPHVSSDDYVGPLFGTSGRPVIIGTSLNSKHHLFWPVNDETDIEKLWSWSESKIGWEFPSK